MNQPKVLIYEEKPDILTFENSITSLAFHSRLNKKLEDHPWEHTMEVVGYSKQILRSLGVLGIDYEVLAAAYWHDVGRRWDGHDQIHAIEGADRAKEVLSLKMPFLDIESIYFAIRHHSAARPKEGYPVIDNMDVPIYINKDISRVLWDADRLALLREPEYCKFVDLNFLSTAWAKQYANTPDHRARYGLPPLVKKESGLIVPKEISMLQST